MGHDLFNQSLMMGIWMPNIKTEWHLVESREVSLGMCFSVLPNTNTMNTESKLISEDGETLTERGEFLSGVTGLWAFKTEKAIPSFKGRSNLEWVKNKSSSLTIKNVAQYFFNFFNLNF